MEVEEEEEEDDDDDDDEDDDDDDDDDEEAGLVSEDEGKSFSSGDPYAYTSIDMAMLHRSRPRLRDETYQVCEVFLFS